MAPEGSQSFARDAVERSAQSVVEEMGEPDHPQAQGIEAVEVGEIAVQGVGPFYSEDPAQRRTASPALLHEFEQVALISDHAKGLACPAIPIRQLLALVNGSLEWAVPGCHGPQLRHGEVRDGVAVRGIGFVILARRALGDRGENLEGHSTFLHPGQVGVPASAPGQPVAFP